MGRISSNRARAAGSRTGHSLDPRFGIFLSDRSERRSCRVAGEPSAGGHHKQYRVSVFSEDDVAGVDEENLRTLNRAREVAGFPKEMALRPSQLRASAAELALLIPAAFALHKDYAVLTMPVAIIAGEDDKLVDTEKQSARLHREIRHSTLRRIAGVWHMVHQSATEAVMAVIDEVQDANLRKVPSGPLALSETP